MGEHEPRHPIGQRRLADTLRPADQPGMRNAPAAIGVQQGHLGIAMAEQRRGFARMHSRDLRFDLTGAHAGLATIAGIGREETIAQGGPYAGRDRRGIGIGVDQHASLRLVGGDLPVRVAQLLMKFDVFGFEPVGRAGAAAGGRALHADLDGNIEDDGQIRLEIADGDPLHRVENRRRRPCPRLP